MTAIAPTVAYHTPYELRRSLVAAVLSTEAGLSADKAASVAEKVLRAVDHIPERVR